jgi:hypothetical protein
MSTLKHSTFNIQRSTLSSEDELWQLNEGPNRKFDLEDRLLEFSSAVIDLSENLPPTRAGNHVAGQMLRSGTAPFPNHGEAEAAESRDDFIHKLKICLKELSRNSPLGQTHKTERLGNRGPNIVFRFGRIRRVNPYLSFEHPNCAKEYCD